MEREGRKERRTRRKVGNNNNNNNNTVRRESKRRELFFSCDGVILEPQWWLLTIGSREKTLLMIGRYTLSLNNRSLLGMSVPLIVIRKGGVSCRGSI